MILLCTLEHQPSDLAVLKRVAKPILRDTAFDPVGKSESRQLEFFAGRAALVLAFEKLGWRGYVEPDPTFGYLCAHSESEGTFSKCFSNISHTKNMAVAVVGMSPVGVDVELISRDPSKVLERVAMEEELLGLKSLSLVVEGARVPGSVALWSAKEAVSKAIGLGIKFGMRDFVVDLKGPLPHHVQVRRSGPLELIDPVIRFYRQGNYLIALCSARQEMSLGIERIQGKY